VTVSDLDFVEEKLLDGNVCWRAKFDDCQFTILDRMTGFGNGIRDTETGYRDKDNLFWLVSGMFDIRDYPDLTTEEAVAKVMELANTCKGI